MKWNKSTDAYFATLDGKSLLDALHGKIEMFYDDLASRGITDLVEMLYKAYYGSDISDRSSRLFESSRLMRSGKQGEITLLKLNHYRNLIKHTKQLATSQKPAFACRANNSDYKSQAQTILGNGLVDYYLREKKLGRVLTDSVETALVMLEGWVHVPWNPNIGESYVTAADGSIRYNGDNDYDVMNIFDVVRDCSLKHKDKFPWLIARKLENRWDLMATYPDLADEIKRVESVTDGANYGYFSGASVNEDIVPVWYFYHEKSPSVRKGRMTIFAGDVMLFDGALPYSKIPLYRLVADKILETPYGYTPAADILGGQEALNILTSTLMTNNAAFGTQSVWTKRGDGVQVTELSGGMKHFQSDEMPQAIQLTKSAPETYNFRQQIIGELETLIGISSTVRGNPEANLKSGSALALVVSQSIQFASMLEQSYNELLEDLGTATLMNLRAFSSTPRVATIVGNFNRPFMKTFNADDLSQINRVVVEQSSPLSKTISGRVEIANQLMQQGMIETPQQYLMVLQTGNLDPVTEGSQSKLLNIRAENESLQNGEIPKVIVTENHAMHTHEHLTLLENPEAKKNEALVQAVLSHVQEHYDNWKAMPPWMLQITGQQPAPQSPPSAPASAPTGEGGGQPGDVMQNEPSLPGDMPGQPNMPALPNGAPAEAQQAYDKTMNAMPQ